MKKLFLATLALFFSHTVLADAPNCYEAGYCTYNGKVKTVYVSSSGKILIYFDTNTTVAEAAKAGFTIVKTNAAQVTISDNPDFAKLVHSTALTAQTLGRNINIQMNSSSSTNLIISNIWLNAPL